MFKYLLVPASGHAADLPVFRAALAVARLSGGHICFLHVCADVDKALISLARSADSPLLESLDRYLGPGDQQLAAAQKAVREFRAGEHLAGRADAQQHEPSAEFKVEAGVETIKLAETGRAADLLVLGRVREHESVATAILEAAILESGRPVLLVPPTARLNGLRTIVIAWNGTAGSARAVANAMPLIEQAERVLVLTADDQDGPQEPTGALLLDALRCHNPATTLRHLPPEPRTSAEALLAAARSEGADLLVMGAYSRAPLREIVLGGFTRHVLSAAELPVLLTH